MVGVPGKYKGCETCRRRRVKCSNERPFCRNCVNSGRQCEGYERERVFITGTPETRGRVASHPKKTFSTRKQKSKADENAKPPVVPMEPLTSAWDDYLRVSSQGTETWVLLTALGTSRQSVAEQEDDPVAGLVNSLPAYAPSELQPHVVGGDKFNAPSTCLVARPGGVDGAGDSTEGYCAFLFELLAPKTNAMLPKVASAERASSVEALGPRHFTAFPNHHYFVRVYRPLAASIALLSRRKVFLSEQDWTLVPWERHPKSPLDQLLDLVLCLPAILAAVDSMLPLPATLTRRFQAQTLLHDCLALEARFNTWLGSVTVGTADQHAPCWSEEQEGSGGEIPFANAYTFRDGLTGLMMLYYWMSQTLFHRSIESVHNAIFQPVVDAYPDMWPDLPPSLQIDPTQYQDGRELAANICRGLDAVLDSTTQPDMLLAPMTVALDLYRDINATSPDGILEILWLEAFKRRLAAKGQHIANVLRKQQWVQLASY